MEHLYTIARLIASIILLCTNLGCGKVEKLSNTKTEIPAKPNILFIVVDDLRPTIGCYGDKIAISPNIDRIADNGFLFQRAYCQYPVCGPSRSSFLSGMYATESRFQNNNALVDETVPDIVQLPQLFKNNGYYTISDGKIYHDHGNVIDGMDGWSEIPWESNPGFWVWRDAKNEKYNYKGYRHRGEYKQNPGPATESPEVQDDAYPTGMLTNKAISDIKRLKNMDKPFFLAVGYRKPHLPHNAPKKYWDVYDKSQFKIADNYKNLSNLPQEVQTNSAELRNYRDIPDKGPIDEETWLRLIHGYYACVSYTDAQIGRLMNEIKKQGLSDNTIVIVIGDHGYQLTEHGMWGKRNTLNVSMTAPLIISVPGKTNGKKTKKLVEFVDIYPSLAELSGLPLPGHLQGKSFKPLIEGSDLAWKDAVFTRCGNAETIITEKFEYTEWINEKGNIYEKMLFNIYEDPLENNNLTGVKKYEKPETKLSDILHQHLENVNIVRQD